MEWKEFRKEDWPNGPGWPNTRKYLTEVLGQDVGDDLGKWFALYESRIADLPTPLSKDQRDEMKRVEAAINDYWGKRARRIGVQ